MKKSIITLAAVALSAMVFTACPPSKAQIEYQQEWEAKSAAFTQAIYDSLRAIYDRDTIVMVTIGDKSYKTVMIGEQVWMAENLNMKIGTSICYENNEENCNQCGRLYDWETARNACPSGWSLPGGNDWAILRNSGFPLYLYGRKQPPKDTITGADIRAKNGWAENGNGEDKYGFSVLPCGALHYNATKDFLATRTSQERNMLANFAKDSFKGYGSSAYYWYAGRRIMNNADYMELKPNSNWFEKQDTKGHVGSLFSVRCIWEYPKLKYTPPSSAPF